MLKFFLGNKNLIKSDILLKENSTILNTTKFYFGNYIPSNKTYNEKFNKQKDYKQKNNKEKYNQNSESFQSK